MSNLIELTKKSRAENLHTRVIHEIFEIELFAYAQINSKHCSTLLIKKNKETLFFYFI